MNIVKIKRGAELLQTLYYSLENGVFYLVLVDHLRTVDEQPVIYVPERINILLKTPEKFYKNAAGHFLPEPGAQKVSIQTLWKELVLTNAGSVIQSLSNNNGQSMEAVEIDVNFFMKYQGLPIVFSMVNGRIRAIEGYNENPVFALNGGLMAYDATQPNESLAPAAVKTGRYKTHKADGTEINPQPAPPADETEPQPETL